MNMSNIFPKTAASHAYKLVLSCCLLTMFQGAVFPAMAQNQTGTNGVIEVTAVEMRNELCNQAITRPLNSGEYMQLCVAYFANGEFKEALTVARLGLGTTTNDHQKAQLYIVISQSYGGLGDYTNAAYAALTGQRCDANSFELAALRYAYFDKIKDSAQTNSAMDTMLQLNPQGQPVFSVQAAIAVVTFVGKLFTIIFDHQDVFSLPNKYTSHAVLEKFVDIGNTVLKEWDNSLWDYPIFNKAVKRLKKMIR